MSELFHRTKNPIEIRRGAGVWLEDVDGRRYLDAASGALVVNIGHGDRFVVDALRNQAEKLSYVHAASFTTGASEMYATKLSVHLPMDDASVYPVSGGSEAIETALKVARTFHLAKGDESRSLFIGRKLSYHGNTRAALDVGDRRSLREPYLPWLGAAGRVSAAGEYRCPNPSHPTACGEWHAQELEATITRLGPQNVAAFVAEPMGGATSGATLPPDSYWALMANVCRKYGVLIVADEVMTGFGRTGEWFASEHFGLRPDIMTLAKGASSGYWPLGVCAFSADIADTIRASPGFVHGFTFSHHPVGASVGAAVIDRIEQLGLVEAARIKGSHLMNDLVARLGDHPHVGDIRGRGLLIAVEFVQDKDTRTPFSRGQGIADDVARAARDVGLVVYATSGCANGTDGDHVLIGPPLIIDDEIATITELLAKAVDQVPSLG